MKEGPPRTGAARREGPLSGVRVVEFAGIGPAPFCGMMLADHGADVIRVDRPKRDTGEPDFDAVYDLGKFDVMGRGKRSIAIDLKGEAGRDLAKRLIAGADVLLEGFRPGVMESLGLGPEDVRDADPKLVYARMTGWGQTGPWAETAGHDINYLGLSGALHITGRAGERPVAAPAMLGDFGGGGMMMAFGIAAALFEARATGRGRVVDAAIQDGAGLFTAAFQALRQVGAWTDETGRNFIDSGSDFYDVYECADGRFLAVGPIEPAFAKVMIEVLGLAPEWMKGRFNPANWAARKAELTAIFRTKTRDDWAALFDGVDACVTPVLAMGEVADHPHNRERGAFVIVDGVLQPAPAPRFEGAHGSPPAPPLAIGAQTEAVLRDAGLSSMEIDALFAEGAVAGPRADA